MPENQYENTYNFQSLQEEAIQRAREMQARAHLSPPVSSEPVMPEPPQKAEPPSEMPASAAVPPHPGCDESPDEGPVSFLDTLLKDNGRTLIWVLLLILLEEKADTALIFALLYLAT